MTSYRLFMSRISVAMFAAFGGVTPNVAPASCSTPEHRLTEIGVSPAEVADIEIQNEYGTQHKILQSWAWARMNDCDGAIVVKLSSNCGRQGSAPFAVGRCSLPGEHPR
jgi:hypothetical protein